MTGRSSAALTRLRGRLESDYEGFMRAYHKRSNVETAFGVMKKMWGGDVNARNDHAMYAELMCKAICHNVSRIVHVVHELDIEPRFWMPAAPAIAIGAVPVPEPLAASYGPAPWQVPMLPPEQMP